MTEMKVIKFKMMIPNWKMKRERERERERERVMDDTYGEGKPLLRRVDLL